MNMSKELETWTCIHADARDDHTRMHSRKRRTLRFPRVARDERRVAALFLGRAAIWTLRPPGRVVLVVGEITQLFTAIGAGFTAGTTRPWEEQDDWMSLEEEVTMERHTALPLSPPSPFMESDLRRFFACTRGGSFFLAEEDWREGEAPAPGSCDELADVPEFEIREGAKGEKGRSGPRIRRRGRVQKICEGRDTCAHAHMHKTWRKTGAVITKSKRGRSIPTYQRAMSGYPRLLRHPQVRVTTTRPRRHWE